MQYMFKALSLTEEVNKNDMFMEVLIIHVFVLELLYLL